MPSLGALGPLGAFGPMGLPHGPQSLLKNPQDLHRDDIKPGLAGPSAEERLVSSIECKSTVLFLNKFFLQFQRNSVSPAEREKYRPRSPLDNDSDAKRRKEEIKVNHVSHSLLELLNRNNKIANGKMT